jgi:hypothetical protein
MYIREKTQRRVVVFVELDGLSWWGGCVEERKSGGGNHIGDGGQCGLQREEPPIKYVTMYKEKEVCRRYLERAA